MATTPADYSAEASRTILGGLLRLGDDPVNQEMFASGVRIRFYGDYLEALDNPTYRPMLEACASLTSATASGKGPLLLIGLFADAPTPKAFVPVLEENFPDAFVLLHGSRFIAYATNEGRNVPVATSTDLVTWTFPAGPDGKPLDAMPQLGAWAKEG